MPIRETKGAKEIVFNIFILINNNPMLIFATSLNDDCRDIKEVIV